MKWKSLSFVLSLLVLLSFFPSSEVYADVAPPEMPPGSNLNPGDENTQVRMMAETVILNVRQDPQNDQSAIADTTATFTMRNLGTSEETMQARFPMSFSRGNSDGFGRFPEINQIAVKVNGKPVKTQRVMQPGMPIDAKFTAPERPDIPWAVFDVTFPPAEDVTIDVAYKVASYGYYPYEAFQYILETGAGWKDTIGSADIVVRFPYEVSGKNVLLPEDQSPGYGYTSQGMVLSGNEARWHLEDLEPTSQNNIEILFVAPGLWKKALNESANVSVHPNDGESWGRLAKAYKEIAVLSKHGDPRIDAEGQQLLQLSRQAYEKCLVLLPNDPLWHFGYADLLWSHYYFDIYMPHEPDTEGLLSIILNELKTSLALDPNNERAKDLLTWISSSIPESVTVSDSGIDYLALTATLTPQAPLLFVTETPTPSPTAEIISSATPVPTATIVQIPTPTSRPTGIPICGGAGLILPVLIGMWWKRKLL